MPIPPSHMKERLEVAYVSAVAARAGAELIISGETEYGIDGEIRYVARRPDGTFTSTGFPFFCQLKATVNCALEDNFAVYDMSADAYRKFAEWEGVAPYILVLFRLPQDPSEWLKLDEEQLLMKNCCYWEHVVGSWDGSGKRIRIPRSQQFTPDAVNELLDRVRNGGF